MPARISAFVVWALVAGAAVFWGLRFAARPAPVPAHAVPVSQTVALAGELTQLLGKPPVAAVAVAAVAPEQPQIASRLRLVGVMAPKAGRAPGAGLAMIAIDGKPARPYAPGATLEGDLVLQTVGLRSAAIGPAAGAAVVTLEVPRLAAPATGTLPPPGNFAPAGVPGAAPVPVPPPPGMQGAPLPLRPGVAPPPNPMMPRGLQMPIPVPPPSPREANPLNQ